MKLIIIYTLLGIFANIACTNINFSEKRIIKIERKNIFSKEYDNLTIDSVAPFTITRNSINDSIALEIPESGTHSSVFLYKYKDYEKYFSGINNDTNYRLNPLRSAEGNPYKLPVIDLTSLPDEKYSITCLECGNIEEIVFSISTKEKNQTTK